MGPGGQPLNRGLFKHARSDELLGRHPELSVEALGDGVWTVAHERARTIFLAGDDGVLAVDTLGTPGAAAAYRDVVVAAAAAPVRLLVYSNDHLNRSGYGGELSRNAEVVAHESAARVVAGRAADGQLGATRTVPSGKTSLDIGGRTVELVHPGPIQGTGTLAVRVPDAGVLFCVGPLPNARYGLLPDYHVGHYASSVRALLELEWDVFVPGRYGLMTRDGLEQAIEYFEELQLVCQKALADGVAVWDSRAMTKYACEKLQGSYGHLGGWHEHVGVTAFRVVHHYLMGGWGFEDTMRPERPELADF